MATISPGRTEQRAQLGYALNEDEGEAFWLLGMLQTIKIGRSDTGGAYGLVEIVVLMLVGVTALRVSAGRMRIDQAFVFFLKWPLLLAIVSLVVAAYFTAGGVL